MQVTFMKDAPPATRSASSAYRATPATRASARSSCPASDAACIALVRENAIALGLDPERLMLRRERRLLVVVVRGLVSISTPLDDFVALAARLPSSIALRIDLGR